VRSTQTKEAARRDAQTARKRWSRAADAAAAPADDAAAALYEQKVANREAEAARKRSISLAIRHLLLVKCGRRVVCRRGSRVQLMPLPRPQTTQPLV